MNKQIKFYDDSVSLNPPPEDPYLDLLNSSYDYWTHPDPLEEDSNMTSTFKTNKPMNDKRQITNTTLLENTNEAKDRDKETDEESQHDWRAKRLTEEQYHQDWKQKLNVMSQSI